MEFAREVTSGYPVAWRPPTSVARPGALPRGLFTIHSEKAIVFEVPSVIVRPSYWPGNRTHQH